MVAKSGALDRERFDFRDVAFGVGYCEGLSISCILVVGVEVAEELSCKGACKVDDQAGEVFLSRPGRGELDQADLFVENGEGVGGGDRESLGRSMMACRGVLLWIKDSPEFFLGVDKEGC